MTKSTKYPERYTSYQSDIDNKYVFPEVLEKANRRIFVYSGANLEAEELIVLGQKTRCKLQYINKLYQVSNEIPENSSKRLSGISFIIGEIELTDNPIKCEGGAYSKIYEKTNKISKYLNTWEEYNNKVMNMLEKSENQQRGIKYSNTRFEHNSNIVNNDVFIDEGVFQVEGEQEYKLGAELEEIKKKGFKIENTDITGEIIYDQDISKKTETGMLELKFRLNRAIKSGELSKTGKLKMYEGDKRAQLKKRKLILENIRNGRLAISVLPELLEGEDVRSAFDEKVGDVSRFFEGVIPDKGVPTDNQKNVLKEILQGKDVLLIQGPPGTGKTTIISALVNYINEENKKREKKKLRPLSVLVASGEHEIVNNVIEKLSFLECPANRIKGRRDREGKEGILAREKWAKDTRAYINQQIKALIEDKNSIYLSDYIMLIDSKEIFDYEGLVDVLSQHKYRNEEEGKEIYNCIKQNDSGSIALDEESKMIKLGYARNSYLELLENNANLKMNYEIYKVLRAYSKYLEDDEEIKNIAEAYSDVMAGTCQQTFPWISNDLERFFRDFVIIDESAKIHPLDLLMSMSLGRRVVLFGDHKQLPPYFDTESDSVDFAGMDELKESLFHKLYKNFGKNKRSIGYLKETYRMHPVITSYISDTFYKEEGGLIAKCKIEDRMLDLKLVNSKPIAWFDHDNLETRVEREDGPSYVNNKEIEIIKSIVQSINEKYNTSDANIKTIGLISFYRAQAERLKQEFENVKNTFSLTVDACQGREYDVVILSCVRSNSKHKVGFIKDNPPRVCVAMSRAKSIQIVVGSSNTMASSVEMKAFLERCKAENGFYKECK